MKCYFHHEQNCFLDYFKDPALNGAIIYADDVPFQYNEWEGKYTEFIGSPTDIMFVAVNMDHKFLLSWKGNVSNISDSSNNFRKFNLIENSSNLIQITPTNPGNMSHPTYNDRKKICWCRLLMQGKNSIKELCKWY